MKRYSIWAQQHYEETPNGDWCKWSDVEPEITAAHAYDIMRGQLDEANERAANLEATASQIVTDWIPANQKLSTRIAEYERQYNADTEAFERLLARVQELEQALEDIRKLSA